MGEPLQNKHRPGKLKDMFGNKGAIKSIESIMNREITDMPSSWLFQGPPGTGKTTLARIIANMLDCADTNLFEYNSANLRGVDAIRRVSEESKLSCFGKLKVYIFDECHAWTKDAQRCTLKMLEDSPPGTFFFLCTTDPQELIAPIQSRCTIIKTSSLTTKQLIKLVKAVLLKEGVEDFPTKVISCIAKNANGAARDAIKLLDTVIDLEDEDEMIEAVSVGVVTDTTTKELCQMLMSKNRGWKEISKMVKGLDGDPEKIRRGVLKYLSVVLLNGGEVKVAELLECFDKNYYNTGKAGLIMSCFEASLL